MTKHFDIIHPKPRAKRKLTRVQKILLMVGFITIVLVAGIYVWMQKANSSAAYIQTDKYQALFLTNSQVYFGKLQRLNDGSYRMSDVYYIKSEAPKGDTATPEAADPAAQQASQQPTLIKLGDELHGPTDEIIVRDNQVLFWENLKADGKVSKAIAAYKKK